MQTAFAVAVMPLIVLLSMRRPDALEEYVGEPAYKSVDPDKPLVEQISVFEIAGRTFEIPKVYIQSNLGDKRVLDGISLLYVLPDYTSRADFANRQEYEEARNARRFAHMMFEPSAIRPSFDVMIHNMHRSVSKFESAGTFDGLQVEKWYRPHNGDLVVYSDVFLEKDETGKVVSWIDCATRERPAKFPGCSHKFRDKGLLYTIYYNRTKYFEDWRAQRASAIAFIDGVETSQQQQP